MSGYRARAEFDRGHYDAATATATAVLEDPAMTAPARITPLAVLGRIRARRGEPDPWSPLDEARELASRTGELQRLAAAAIARAEALWLAGESDRIEAETAEALALALVHQHDAWVVGELCVWRRRAGIVDDVSGVAIAEPFRLELDGEYTKAAKAWAALGCPYESALAAAPRRLRAHAAARARRASAPRGAPGGRVRRPDPARARAARPAAGPARRDPREPGGHDRPRARGPRPRR